MRYVALLRGIAPMNPDMRNDRLREACESVGFEGVQTVLSSGNVVFETPRTDTEEIESRLETAWQEVLGFESVTMVRSREMLERLAELEPFGDRRHNPETYLLVTFSKSPFDLGVEIPYRPSAGGVVVGATQREVFSVVDNTRGGSSEVMGWLEKRLGKQVTTRTWLTVSRILARMGPRPADR